MEATLVKTGVRVKANPVKITPEQVKFYDEFGYVIIPDLYNEEACETIKNVVEQFAEEDFSVILNIHRRVDLFYEIMRDPVLIAIMKTIQRHKVVMLNDQFLFKKPQTVYGKQSWNPHQDNAYVRAPRGAYTQLHIFLDKSEKENGGLFYYPGSHNEDILPYEYVKSWKEDLDERGISHPGWKINEIPPQYERIDVTGPKGGICIQHGNLVHGSYPNLTQDRSREQLSLAYLNEGAVYQEGSASTKIPIAVE